MQRHTAIMLVIVLLSQGCTSPSPGSEISIQSTDLPTRVSTVFPTSASPLPPVPDFSKNILLTGFGGGGGVCMNFDLPASPSVIGGTTYPITRPNPEDSWIYPRMAELCISGVPKNQSIDIKLISPNQEDALTANIKVIDDPQYANALDVIWEGYPKEMYPYAYRESGYGPIEVVLSLWWAGALASGDWNVQVTWPGQTIYGNFYAKTRNLPEISLVDPHFASTLFPNIGGDFTCHLGPYVTPYTVLAENFSPDLVLYILVYHGISYRELELIYQTSVRTDNLGIATAEIPFPFQSGEDYYIFGVPAGIYNISNDSNYLAFSAIANAMDCFEMP